MLDATKQRSIADQMQRIEVALRQLRRVLGNTQQLLASIDRRMDELGKMLEE